MCRLQELLVHAARSGRCMKRWRRPCDRRRIFLRRRWLRKHPRREECCDVRLPLHAFLCLPRRATRAGAFAACVERVGTPCSQEHRRGVVYVHRACKMAAHACVTVVEQHDAAHRLAAQCFIHWFSCTVKIIICANRRERTVAYVPDLLPVIRLPIFHVQYDAHSRWAIPPRRSTFSGCAVPFSCVQFQLLPAA